MRKRIGSTTYEIGIHFNNTSREDMNQKILRLVQNEALTSAPECGTMESLQMGWLPERGSL